MPHDAVHAARYERVRGADRELEREAVPEGAEAVHAEEGAGEREERAGDEHGGGGGERGGVRGESGGGDERGEGGREAVVERVGELGRNVPAERHEDRGFEERPGP